MELEIRHLRSVRAIAEAGSLTAAAAALGVSQPSLTVQLRRIESAVGGQLFLRGKNGAVPTELGEYVLSTCDEILDRMAELRRHATCRAGGERIRIGGMPGPLFAASLDHLCRTRGAPPVASSVHYSGIALIRLLDEQRLDGATLVGFPSAPASTLPEVAVRTVSEGPVFVMLARSHPLAARERLHLAELREENWVLPPATGDGVRGHVRAACEAAGFSPWVPHETSDLHSAGEIVAHGLGVGLLQATAPVPEGVVGRELIGSPLRLSQLFAWHTGGPLAPLAEELVTALRLSYVDSALASPVFTAWLRENSVARSQVATPF
ncbi:LysR family transcriptional regulator [Kutzneria albida]|uniref:HTH lysR-type domain-containing protein n=1 Tax=Kutzneria albida DSM 43870 TaxID=1449976 RepID=W5WG25_9PSEU|nr:LysR family transcriptional regulator [Kutzneria albida]AHH99571.1 hypothetical protein KALB_6211 [Kutzneria albida DSM 43870]